MLIIIYYVLLYAISFQFIRPTTRHHGLDKQRDNSFLHGSDSAYNFILRSFVRDIFSVYQTHHSTPWFEQTTGQHLSSRKRLCLKKTDATGLNTRLGLKNKNPQPPKGTDELECFIKDIQRELIGKILPHNDTQKQNKINRTNFSIDPRCNEKPKRHKPSNYPNRQNKLI